MIYAVVNQKGGVGKTTTSVNLGASLALLDRRVLVVDIDSQANATSGLGIVRPTLTMADVVLDGVSMRDVILPTRIDGLYIAPSGPDLAGAAVELPGRPEREFILRRALADVRAEYDIVILDCPPSLDLITVNALVAADRLIVPVQCEFYALEGLSRLLETITAVQAALNPGLRVTGMLMTMHDPRTRISAEVIGEVRKHFADLAFRAVIPRNVRLAEAPSHGEPVIRYDAASSGAVAYSQVAREVLQRD